MPFGEPGEVSFSMSVIRPASPPQSTQVLPGIASTGWLKTLYASKRNCALTLSVIEKLFARAMSEKKPRGPRKELRPKLPIWPQAGRANAPLVGRASVHVSVVAVTPVYESAGTGVNQRRFPLTSLLVPVLSVPEVLLGRQGPVSEIWPHSAMLGVQGRPPL